MGIERFVLPANPAQMLPECNCATLGEGFDTIAEPSLDSLTDGVGTVTGDRYNGGDSRILQRAGKFYF